MDVYAWTGDKLNPVTLEGRIGRALLGAEKPVKPWTQPAAVAVVRAGMHLVPGLNSALVLSDPRASTFQKVFAVTTDVLSVVGVGVVLKAGRAGVAAARGAGAAPRALLAPVRMQQHHIFPQQFRKFFQRRGIDIDKYTVELSQGRHLGSAHGRGDGITPGRFNQRWAEFIDANPSATAKDVYQFADRIMDEYGLSNLPIVPYR